MTRMERTLQKMDLAVFLALAAGKSKVGEIAEHCDHSAFRVREALKRLQEDGLVERPDYRSWQLAEGGHEVINSLWISYVELFGGRPEAHEMIASTIAEAHKLIASDDLHNDEAHEMIASSAQNDRFSPPFMHVNDHACMDDADSVQNRLANSDEFAGGPLRNKLADSDESAGNRLRDPLAGSDESALNSLEEELKEIGFDQPRRWLRKENVSWELVSDWLEYVNSNGGIRNKAGFVRKQVEAGEKPNLEKARRKQVPRNQVPAEYEHLILR